jgi:hypothetical protein
MLKITNILKKYKYIFIGVAVVFILYFGLRNTILHMVFARVQHKLEAGYALKLKAQKVTFTGFKTVSISGLEVDQDSARLLFIDTLKMNPRIFPLFVGKLLLKEIDMREGDFSFNISQLRKIKKITSTPTDSIPETSSPANYSKVAYNIIHSYFQYIPSRLKVNKFTISYQRDTLYANFTINQFLLKGGKFSGTSLIKDNLIDEAVLFDGTVDNYRNKISFRVRNADKHTVILPYIGVRWHSVVSFDSINGQFSIEKYRSGTLHLNMNSGIHNLLIQDSRIGPEAVITKSGSGNLNLRITERSFEVDSTSVLSFNNFSFSPYFRFEKDPSRLVVFKIIKQEFEASRLLKSFPEGLFSNINQLETKGKLSYSLSASLNLDHPDKATLDSKMEKKDFSITKYGDEDFRKMNGSFRYEVYEKDRFIRAFTIGPENPNFTPLDQISPYLKYSVLTSEDGDFFYHRGFNQDAFRESISKNWQEKRFARGGSTISMQLVKNVFLSRKKTIARKVEEMLIVWMIENLRLTSKDRMFEVYLNIIEWGPNIYGVKEASRFYFNKLPSQLNLKESIFLTSLVPRPKGFKYAFDTSGTLRKHYEGYYRLLSGIMLRRNQITPEDTINLRPDIELTGAAKFYLTKREDVQEDSIYYLEPKAMMIVPLPLSLSKGEEK